MIARYRPVWNVLSGFGNNDPGKNRYNAPRPPWHELHPGVGWAARMQPAEQAAPELAQFIERLIAGDPQAEEEAARAVAESDASSN